MSEPKTALGKMALAEMARRELSRRHLLRSVKRNFGTYQENWHHRLIAEKLEAVERGEIKRLMVFMPPRMGKSELCSVQFPPWFLGRNPTKDIIASSYSGELASSFGRKARNIASTTDFKRIFGIGLAEDSQSAASWSTDKGGSYLAVGVGGSITGRGASVLLIDDPHKNREEADSPQIRDKIWDWYRSTAYTRLSPDGAVVLIMTRWHDDDLAGRLLAEERAGGDKWEVVSLPAIATHHEAYRASGEALWPKKFSFERLSEIRRVLGAYEWSSLYMQNPVDQESQEFKSHLFLKRTLAEVLVLGTNRFLTVDTAVSKSASADYTAFVTNYVDTQNKWNIRCTRGRLSPLELIDKLFELYARDRYTKIGIEKTIYLQAVKPFLDDEMRRRNVFLPVVEVDHNQTQKETRMRGLLPRYESGSVYHVEGECVELEEEMVRFPKGAHDDCLDALAYQLQLAEAPDGIGEDISYGLYKTTYS